MSWSLYDHNVRVLGDLPLKGRWHWASLAPGGWGVCPWGTRMESLEIDLHKQGQECNDIVLTCYTLGRRAIRYPMVSYHPDLLPNWEAFAKAHQNRKGLKSILIDRVRLPGSPFFEEKMIPILNRNTGTLLSLTLRECHLEPRDVISVTRFIKKNKTLATLDLSTSYKSLSELKALSNAIGNHPALFSVNLSDCYLGCKVDVLSAILDGAASLKSLLLEGNCINSSEGLVAIAEFLTHNTSLMVFGIANNEIAGAEDTKILAKALKKNDALQELGIGGSNRIAVPTFLGSSRVADKLSYLDLSHRKISMADARSIASFLKRSATLKELSLSTAVSLGVLQTCSERH